MPFKGASLYLCTLQGYHWPTDSVKEVFIWLIYVDWYYMVSPKETLIISQQFVVVRTYTNQSLPGCITWLEHPLEASLTKRSNQRDEGIWGFIVIGKYMIILCVNLQQMLAKVNILQRIKLWSITQCPSGVRNSTCAPCRAITRQVWSMR